MDKSSKSSTDTSNNQEMIRLNLVKAVVQMFAQRQNDLLDDILIQVDELYEYVKTGKMPEDN